MMRQTGHYFPEYKVKRAEAGGFMSLCHNADLVYEVFCNRCAATLTPLDIAIPFSEILTVPNAMGLGLWFEQDEGPCFTCSI